VTRGLDVVCLGEVLIEVATAQPFGHGVPATMGVSGDPLNVAAAAAAAGAQVGLVAVLPDDELGEAIAAQVAALGIATDLLRFRAGQQGVYLTHSDPRGERQFSYARSRSVGSTLGPEDLPSEVLPEAGAVVASGISCAISTTATDAVLAAARSARRFVYDPNFRPRLTSSAQAGRTLRELAPHCWLATPSHPAETLALIHVDSPLGAAHRLRELGVENVAVTCGDAGVHLSGPGVETWVEAVPAPSVVDQTGAGDAYVGTLAARLVLGDDLLWAARQAAAAAALVVGGHGGTGRVPTLEQTRALLATAGEAAG
jgi:2-dehydro-3-deoxygluconokinase